MAKQQPNQRGYIPQQAQQPYQGQQPYQPQQQPYYPPQQGWPQQMPQGYQGQPPFPVMLYFWEMGEKISIQYAQGGTDEAYIEAIEKTLGDLGINIL